MTFSQKMIAFFSAMSGVTAYFSIFGVLFACGLGLPIPEDITIISAGILVALKKISMTGAMIVCLAGVLLGDSMLFFLGRKFGKKVYTWPVIRRIAKPDRIESMEKWVNKHSRFICFICRFLPGARAPAYLTAGTVGISPTVFWLQDGLAALISVPLWVYFGYYFGNNIDQLLLYAKEAHNYIIVGVLALITLYFGWKKLSKKLAPQ